MRKPAEYLFDSLFAAPAENEYQQYADHHKHDTRDFEPVGKFQQHVKRKQDNADEYRKPAYDLVEQADNVFIAFYKEISFHRKADVDLHHADRKA